MDQEVDLGFPFTELLEEGPEVFWQGRFDRMRFAVRVGESEELGMEGEAREEGAFGFFGL